MILTVLSVIAPVFIVAAMGFVWTKSGMRFDAQTVSGLSTNIGMPCLVFTSLAGISVGAEELGRIAIAGGLAMTSCALVGAIILRLAGLPLSHYLPAVAFPNLANIGLPMCLFAFGEPGLALAMGYLMVGSLIQITMGIWLASGKISPAGLFNNPIMYVIPIALLFRFGGYEVPQWLNDSTKLAGNMALPVMLMALGASLSQIKLAGAWRSSILSLLRFAIGISVGFGIAEILGLSGVLRSVVILQTAMPSAVFNHILALQYDNDPETVAGIVMQSSLMSVIVLPLLLLVLLP